jgi:hypothetical protein
MRAFNSLRAYPAVRPPPKSPKTIREIGRITAAQTSNHPQNVDSRGASDRDPHHLVFLVLRIVFALPHELLLKVQALGPALDRLAQQRAAAEPGKGNAVQIKKSPSSVPCASEKADKIPAPSPKDGPRRDGDRAAVDEVGDVGEAEPAQRRAVQRQRRVGVVRPRRDHRLRTVVRRP